MDIVVLIVATIAALLVGLALGRRRARSAIDAHEASRINLTRAKQDLGAQRAVAKSAATERDAALAERDHAAYEHRQLRTALKRAEQLLAATNHPQLLDIVGIEAEVASLRVIARDVPGLRAQIVQLEAALAAAHAEPIELRPPTALAT